MTLMEKFNSRLSSIVKIPELRERIIFTLLMFLVARVEMCIRDRVDPEWNVALSERLKDYKPYCGDYYIVNSELYK